MISMPLNQIDKLAIEDLVQREVRESRTLEYKDQLPTDNKESKKEFLADISAMANGAGGDIVYGIAERRDRNKPTGIPEAITGLAGNLDAEKLRLENILRDGIEPRILGLQIHSVEGFDGGPVLVIRVPKSYLSPHMLKTGDSRFYSRNSSGKYPLDVSEIRSAFAVSDTLPARIRGFRDERIARIIADELPVPIPLGPKVVLHLLPFSALDPTTRVDISLLAHRSSEFKPLSSENLNSWMPRYNFDGVLVTGDNYAPETVVYLQLFRNGSVESLANKLILKPDEEEARLRRTIPTGLVEKTLIKGLHNHIRLLEALKVDLPVAVMLTLIGVKDYRLWVPTGQGVRFLQTSNHAINRDTLMLPEGMLNSYDQMADKILQPAFDVLWQSVGQARDLFYQDDGDGRWLEQAGSRPIV